MLIIIVLNSIAQNVVPDLPLECPLQYPVVTQSLDTPFHQLSSPPDFPAPSLEHALDQHKNEDEPKTIPAMYDLPENYSSKKVKV